MKIHKHLSLVAVSIAVISIILKIQFDIQSYQVVSEVLTETNGDSCPTVLGGGMISTTLYLTLAILSLALSIIGYKKRNQFRKFALWLNILAILYIFVTHWSYYRIIIITLCLKYEMSWLNEIYNFLEDYTDEFPKDSDVDIWKDLKVRGDDFHAMMDHYGKAYKVDMSNYLWYFHTAEEGHNLGSLFIKPPNERVERIPVTPQLLADFVVTRKWEIDYPEHTLPKRRYDIWINFTLLIIFIVWVVWMIF